MSRIELAQGAGGRGMQELLDQVIRPALSNPLLDQGHDGAYLPGQGLVMTTDSYVVSPLFFPGGNIGKLAVCGTVNDLAMCGAEPLWLSLGLIIEAGFEYDDLQKILASLAQTAKEAGVVVVTGDTKVVEAGKGDGIYINTTGIGRSRLAQPFSPKALKVGDRLLINGGLAEHGLAILAARESLPFETPPISDCACLHGLVETMLATCPEIRLLRDPTRGGLAALGNELASASSLSILLKEKDLPIKSPVQAALQMLGIDPLSVANEGKLVAFCPEASAEKLLKVMQAHPLGRDSAIIGEVIERQSAPLWIQTQIGTRRLVEMPLGEQLPRIC
ncbi:MAG: hydrogenase expression/formation protein HypE [Candidatus Lambdaproteobacteria bacterium RIFOXYD2_FULL_50_16]|uniref:Hydrogenase expression/formation protein HypE n=1 Tax=Candidatus Lambdaproteobacteria bacterium RIFOXYD2_FULL_50_16 TaxID=1817772 RepID=A0A1F6G4S3_9PROT|nr:MAG: hydrogenase expression/formation protein HypE [Candidatus Lambdaproteobacteria bacterium RIFOXYD2_FULL_50_16]